MPESIYWQEDWQNVRIDTGEISMKRLYAIAVLLSAVVTVPVLVSPNHKGHTESQRPAAVQVGRRLGTADGTPAG